MKQVSTNTTNQWLSGDYTGPNKPVMRATIQRPQNLETAYTVPAATTVNRNHEGHLRSLLFNQTGPIRELPNIESIKWTRKIDQDTATCEIVLLNTAYHDQTSDANQLDEPGYLTANRGTDPFFTIWGYPTNEWNGWLEPDRIIRTYEGYGTNGSNDPAADTNLYPSGVWRIDDVTLDTDGKITLTCRDLLSILIDQVIYPPAVPFGIYPLWFEAFRTTSTTTPGTTVAAWKVPAVVGSSNSLWTTAYRDGKSPAIAANGAVLGHLPAEVTSTKADKFWLTPGSAQPEWAYIDLNIPAGDTVGAVQFTHHGGPLQVWVSVKHGASWLGAHKVPYQQTRDTPNLSANVPYVATGVTSRTTATFTLKLPKTYRNVQTLRITVRTGWKSKFGTARHFRTAISGLRLSETVGPVTTSTTTGNVADYTDVVSWLCGWAGLHQPHSAVLKTISGNQAVTDTNNPAFPAGAGGIFGDVRPTGTAPIARIQVQTFDQQPMMDGVKYAEEATGFKLALDEWGGVIWRMPNIFTKGNFLAGANGGAYTRVNSPALTLQDNQVLTQVSVKISNADVREQIFVADLDAKYGATVAGYNPAPTGLNRVAGITDYRLTSTNECIRMADLLAIKMFYKYRQNTVDIPGNPAIQLDDQIVIQERITGEGYLHHVVGIESQWQAGDGKWVYTITTEWLGSASSYTLGFDATQLDPLTVSYLQNLGLGITQ